MLANAVSGVSNPNFSFVVANGDSKLDSNDTRKVVFRMLCSNVAAGAIIGKKGAIVRAWQNQTGASIMFESPETENLERVVTISALEDLESQYSPTQNALVLVFAKSVKSDIEKGFPSGLSKGTAVTLRFLILVTSDLVSCLKEKEGRILSEIAESTGADVQILDEELSLGCCPENVVQITGDYKSVQNAIFQVTSRLRDNLMPTEVLNEIRVGNCHGQERETGPSQVHQQTSSTLDDDPGPNLAQRMHPGHSENTSGPQPVKPQCLDGFILQTAGNGHTVAMGDVQHGSTTFGGSFNIENSLDFLLPCDMLNEVGGSSPYNGGSETIFSGLLQSLDTSLVSGQESALTRAVFFDGVDSPPESHLIETVRRRHRPDNADGKRGLELERGRKSTTVKNTSVEIAVHEDAFGSIYGKDGCNLARLKEISGAKVEVHDPSPGETEGMVLISETPDQTLVAQSLLQAFIQANQLST
ncbi:hypothetical protein V6N13_112172 [Hibiscus sabdariffa]|uniref:K Homology domain-containing protein n=1 Tax=Hibiscus sabdariffa TaxID=183260 RepID=A0ABR2TMZ4_9ROSI